MAEDVGALYVRLGLNLSELETGFVNASQTVAANISRLNREADLVRIRSQVEIAGLDEAVDAERILQVRADALNQQMQIQRDRVRILDAELQNLTRSQGVNSIATQRATIRLERERLALARLERDVRDVTAAITELNSTDINVSGSTSIAGGTGGSVSGGGAGSSWTDLLPVELPTNKIEAFAAAMAAMGVAVGTTTQIISDALNDFRETEKQAYELNIDFNDAEQFLRELKLGGGDIGDFEGYIRGITDAWVKGEWDDPEFIALRKYGAEITDATGRLKNFKDLTEEVYQAWKQADEAGEGIEFLQLTGGEAGVRDAIQFFKRYEEAQADAAKIVDANLDDKQWHEVERSINLATEQADEFKEAIANIFTPAVEASAESFFNILRDGTEKLIESKDALQEYGFITKELFSELAPTVNNLFPSGQAATVLDSLDRIFSGLSRGDEKANEEFYRKSFIANIGELFKDNSIYQAIERGKQKFAEYNGGLEDTNTVAGIVAKGLEALTEAQKENGDVLSQYGAKRIAQFRDELEDLKIELEFGDNDYGKKLAELDLWKKRELTDKLHASNEEQLAIEELYSAKLDQIKKEHADAIAEYWQNAADIGYEMTHTALEKELRDIELWKEAQEEKAATAEDTAAIIANAAAKEAQAFEREVDRIKGQMQSLDDKIFALDHSQYENDLRRIQQEYIRGIQEAQEAGTLPLMKDKLDYLYQRQKQELAKKAAKGGDYTKTPNGGLQRGGNGIVVIGGDTVLDDGLTQAQTKNIGLLVDENKIREQLLPNLTDAGREFVAAQQAIKNFTDAQNVIAQSAEKTASGFQLIEGDKVVGMPEMPTETVKEFDLALQQSAMQVEQANPAEALTSAENQLAENLKQALPTEYFQNMADGIENISGLQQRLAESTLELIDAQGALKEALKTTPTSAKDEGGYQQLSYKNQQALEPLPTPTQQSRGFQFGFDMDTAGTALSLGALLAGIGGAPITAPIAALLAGGAAGLGLAKGSWDATNAPQASVFGNADLTEIIAPLTSIDNKFDTVITPLSSIEKIVGQIFSALSNQEARQINVSPNVDIDLGGAYVFDNELKMSLVEDITNRIVTSITETVEKATSQRTYGFST